MSTHATRTFSRRHLLTGAAILAATVGLSVPSLSAAGGAPPGRGAGPGFGPGFGRGGPMGHGGPAGELMAGLRRLDLTDAQRDQVRTILDQHRDEFQSTMEQAMKARRALNAAVTADTFDEGAIRRASEAVAAAEADGAVLRGRVHQEIWSVLTEEQRTKAKALKAEFEQRMQERRERMGERVKERRRAPAE